MTDEEYFESAKYRFYFSQAPTTVHLCRIYVNIFVVPIEVRRKVTNEDKNELEEFFEDMGKWEIFVKAGKGLLRDLGIPIEIEKEEKTEFGAEKYEKVLEKAEDNEGIKVTINLTAKESLRRSKGDSEYKALSIDEILQQVKNVPKWQTLKKAMLELKSQLYNDIRKDKK